MVQQIPPWVSFGVGDTLKTKEDPAAVRILHPLHQGSTLWPVFVAAGQVVMLYCIEVQSKSTDEI